MELYVGNLPQTITSQRLRELFEQYGSVSSVDIMKDRRTGESRGFGFVVMDDPRSANRAIAGISRTAIAGHALRVERAHPKNFKYDLDLGIKPNSLYTRPEGFSGGVVNNRHIDEMND